MSVFSQVWLRHWRRLLATLKQAWRWLLPALQKAGSWVSAALQKSWRWLRAVVKKRPIRRWLQSVLRVAWARWLLMSLAILMVCLIATTSSSAPPLEDWSEEPEVVLSLRYPADIGRDLGTGEVGLYAGVSNSWQAAALQPALVISLEAQTTFANAHYTAQQMKALKAVIRQDKGIRASNAYLMSRYHQNQCRGYVDDVIFRAYGILDRTNYDRTTYGVQSQHYRQVARLVYHGKAITPQQVRFFFSQMTRGDTMQMNLRAFHHSAVFLYADATGTTWLDANWQSDNVVRVHRLTYVNLAHQLSAYGKGITGYWMH